MRLIALVCVVLFSGSAFGQAPTLRAGSVEAYKFMAQQQSRAAEAEMNWDAAKKLSRFKDKPGARIKNETPLNMLEDEQVCYVSSWATTVTSVVDSNNSIIRMGQETIWLADFPTESMSDGLSVRIVDPVKFLGTRSYETVAGSKSTVRVLKVLTLEEQKKWDEIREKQQAVERENKLATLPEFELKDGSKIRGELVSSKNGIVQLLDVDYKTHEIKIANLTPATTANVRKLLKQKENEQKKKRK